MVLSILHSLDLILSVKARTRRKNKLHAPRISSNDAPSNWKDRQKLVLSYTNSCILNLHPTQKLLAWWSARQAAASIGQSLGNTNRAIGFTIEIISYTLSARCREQLGDLLRRRRPESISLMRYVESNPDGYETMPEASFRISTRNPLWYNICGSSFCWDELASRRKNLFGVQLTAKWASGSRSNKIGACLMMTFLTLSYIMTCCGEVAQPGTFLN